MLWQPTASSSNLDLVSEEFPFLVEAGVEGKASSAGHRQTAPAVIHCCILCVCVCVCEVSEVSEVGEALTLMGQLRTR